MRNINILLILITLVLMQSAQAQEKQYLPIKDIQKSDLAFTEGERLTYIAKYTWGSVNTDIGEALITLQYVENEEREPYFHAKVIGKTYKFFDMFFKVRDVYESKFETKNIRPFYFYRDINEGSYRMRNTFTFLPNHNIKAKIQKMEEPIKDTILKGKSSTFDVLSLFYFARNLDFSNAEIGATQPLSFVIDGDVFDIYYRFLGRENKRVQGLGHFKTLKFAARLVAGEVFTGKEEMIIWVSDDQNKIPIYFESPIIVGKVSGRLAKYSNLKYPLSSKH